MFGLFVTLLVISLVTAQDLELICPKVEFPNLPEGTFMQQVSFDCQDNLYGKIYYTCFYGKWMIMEECRCQYEKDKYGFHWWGVKVNKTETVETNTGSIQRFCKASGWGDYDGSDASKCKGFGIYPDTPRGDHINMCIGEGTSRVTCNYSGQWVYTEGECFCPAADGWDKVLERERQERACGSHIEYRMCGTGGVWGSIDSSNCFCDDLNHFKDTGYGMTNKDNHCDNGVMVTRECSSDGVWQAIGYQGLCKCMDKPGWQDGLVGGDLVKECSYGATSVVCNEVGHWEYTQNDCACAADSIWVHTALNGVREKVCGNGGRLRRTCLEKGYWEEVQDFNCKCPAIDNWGETDRGTYGRAGCGNGFALRLCGEDGQWTNIYDRQACYCSPQSGWQLTLNGETASKACPAGEMTRTCSEWGMWGAVDYSNCMCKALDGFEATLVNTVATTSCFDADGVPDPINTQQRYCGPTGDWGDVDQTMCPVKWCPSVQSWYKVPVGSRPTTVTIGCMSGERSRVCNVNGVWGPVTTDHCACTYIKDEVEELLRPGFSYDLPCSEGQRVYMCNSDSGYFDPVDLKYCRCKGEGAFSTTSAGELSSTPCSLGTATRICSLDGQWEERDNRHCFCAQENGIWRQTNAGTTVSVLCDIGFRMRECSIEGFWSTAEQTTCKCSSIDREQEYGTTSNDRCDEGIIEYHCREDGHFDTPNSSSCYCKSRYEFGLNWNRLNAGLQSPSLTCMNAGSVRRTCGAMTGQWEDLDSTICRCTTQDEWTEAGVGEYAISPCTTHSTGLRRRQCNGYQWGTIDNSDCQDSCIYNHGNGNITYVTVGAMLEVPCYINLDGVMSYQCVHYENPDRSILELIESTCARLACESDYDGSLVNVGEIESRPCIAGFLGTRQRTCLSGGIWSDYDLKQCQPYICQPITHQGIFFSYTLAGIYGEAKCNEGYNGVKKLFCNLIGQWEGDVIEECLRNICPAEGAWPSTPSNESSTIECPTDYTGVWTRLCMIDGTWEELMIPTSCIPIPPTTHTIPYQGSTHVSRAPSASLFTSLAIKAPYQNCTVSVVSMIDDEERYELVVNVTKTSMEGRHRNGGVFADFILSSTSDVHDMANYLGYGEYKMLFPSCWHALNNAIVPTNSIEVVFHTTPVPPSAPTNIRLEYSGETFTILFDEPIFVDAPYPVIAYYLAFQPPILSEVRVDATIHSFGPFEYLPGEVTLLLRAENAFGLSSPDVEAPYSFDDVLMDATEHLRLETAAPKLTLISQVPTNNAVSVSIAVAAPIMLQQFVKYLEMTCNGEAVETFSTVGPTVYVTTASAGTELIVTCFFSLAGTAGNTASLTVQVVSSSMMYGEVIVQAKEVEAQLLHLTWRQPELYSTQPIRAYAVQCKREDQTTFVTTRIVTSIEAMIAVPELVPGPVQCRVAASSILSLPEKPSWGYVTVRELHSVKASDLTVTVESHAVYVIVRINVPYCVAAVAVLQRATKEMATSKLVCENGMMMTSFAGLKIQTEYEVIIQVPVLAIKKSINVKTTALQTETMTMELVADSTSGSAADVIITASSLDAFYCVATTSPLSVDLLLQQVAAGVLDDAFEPASTADYTFSRTMYLQDLKPNTVYSVTCVGRHSLATAMHANLFTTALTVSPLLARDVEIITPFGRLPQLLFTFDGSIEVTEKESLQVSCGGLPKSFALTKESVEGLHHNQLLIQLKDMLLTRLPADSVCSVSFSSLGAVHRMHNDASDSGLLSPLNPRFSFMVSQDAMRPVLSTLQTAELEGSWAVVAIISEIPLTPLADLEYTVQCRRRGEPTVQRVFSTVDHPVMLRSGFEARKGYADVKFFTGLLPHLHDCEIRLHRDGLVDGVQNAVECEMQGDDCVVSFVSRATAPNQMTLDLVIVTPADGTEYVAVNAPVVFTFNREVESAKPVVFRCMDCVKTIVMITPRCSGMQCIMENTEGWEADSTYYITYDATTFRAAWSTFYLALPERFNGFSTAASVCNMEYIASEWDTTCSCVNTGSHCQCNCGATAILKAF